MVVLGGAKAGTTSLVDAFLGKRFDPRRAAGLRCAMRVMKSVVSFGQANAASSGESIGVHVDITEKKSSSRRTPFAWKLYAGSAAAVLVCFDVQRRKSLVDTESCLSEIQAHAHSRLISSHLPIFLVGCKADCGSDSPAPTGTRVNSGESCVSDQAGGSENASDASGHDVGLGTAKRAREVSFEEAAAFATARGLVYVETCAKEHDANAEGSGGVTTPFLLAARAVAASNGWLPLGSYVETRLRMRSTALKQMGAEFQRTQNPARYR